MRVVSAALAGLSFVSIPTLACARDLIATRPTVICASEEALGRLVQNRATHPDATISPTNVLQETRHEGGCIDLPAGSRVSLQMVHGANNVVIYKLDSNSDALAFIATTGDFRAASADGQTPAGATAATTCLREGARVAIRGVVTAFDGIDGRTGTPHSYVALRIAPAPCITAKDGATVSTEELGLQPDTDQEGDIRDYEGRPLFVTGLIVVGADGAPGLAHVTFIPRP